MVEALSKWLIKYFSMIYAKKRNETFDFQEAMEILKKDERFTGQILSKLNRAGWITKKREENDRRKKVYSLNSPNVVLNELGQKID